MIENITACSPSLVSAVSVETKTKDPGQQAPSNIDKPSQTEDEHVKAEEGFMP